MIKWDSIKEGQTYKYIFPSLAEWHMGTTKELKVIEKHEDGGFRTLIMLDEDGEYTRQLESIRLYLHEN